MTAQVVAQLVPETDRHVRRIVRNAGEVARSVDRPSGYAIVVWNRSGTTTCTSYHHGNAMPPRLMPTFVAEVLRRAIERDAEWS